jgi:hypothetical protein
MSRRSEMFGLLSALARQHLDHERIELLSSRQCERGFRVSIACGCVSGGVLMLMVL